MSEGLGGTVTVPKLGKVKKAYFWGAVGIVGAYVAWRWYSANAGAGEDVAYSTDAVGEGLSASGVVGAGGVSGNAQYAGSTTDGTGQDVIDTNAEWTNQATEILSDAGVDRAAIRAALGEFLARRPLDDSEASIARQAMAVAGEPPEGRPWTIVAQIGQVDLKAPTGVKVTAVTTTSVTLAWTKVTGASLYRVYREGAGTNVGTAEGSASSFTVTGLQPNTPYRFRVAADTTTGKAGPFSPWVSATTSGLKLATPRTPTVDGITRSSVRVATGAVPGATGYAWYINGVAHGHSDGPRYTVVSLRPNTAYRVSVAADYYNGPPGKQSPARAFRTKK